MFSMICLYFVPFYIVSGQINGEFWWLNEKLAKLREVETPLPTFDGTNEFETDENIKIVFRDEELYSNEAERMNTLLNEGEVWPTSITFRDISELANPVNVKNDIKINKNMSNMIKNVESINLITEGNIPFPSATSSNKLPNTIIGDIFEFDFPEKMGFNTGNTNKNNKSNETSPSNNDSTYKTQSTKIAINDKIWFEDKNDNNFENTESICTFLKKTECLQNKGTVHITQNACPKLQNMFENQKVCCILPHPTEFSTNFKYPEEHQYKPNRSRRSATTDKPSTGLKQRNALLQRKLVTLPVVKPTASAKLTKVTQKIVTPDDYVDPYWNIKNSKFRNPSEANGYQNTKYDYSSNQDYGDYTVELPRPGLIGLYSDVSPSQTTWKLSNKNKGFSYDGTDEVSEEESDDNPSFGYSPSTLDPRRGMRVSTSSPKSPRRKPVKLVTSTEDMNEQSSHTVTFKSKPDFHVFEGFKLINQAGNKNRFVRKTAHKSDNINEETNIQPGLHDMTTDNNYEDVVDVEQQVYKRCGQRYTSTFIINDAAEGTDPWLALVIQTKSRQKILCYATVVHPRIAVTAADCVHGSPVGEISVVSGVWELNESQPNSQQRLCTVRAHPLYKAGELDNNIALLHWKRPLKLDARVQPACLDDPRVGDDCYFVGWGGYDTAIMKVSRQQRASVLTPRQCSERISKPDISLPLDAFCASVNERATVTGVGGPLLCRSWERTSVVGVAVWREDVVVLLPVLQWVTTTIRDVLQM